MWQIFQLLQHWGADCASMATIKTPSPGAAEAHALVDQWYTNLTKARITQSDPRMHDWIASIPHRDIPPPHMSSQM